MDGYRIVFFIKLHLVLLQQVRSKKDASEGRDEDKKQRDIHQILLQIVCCRLFASIKQVVFRCVHASLYEGLSVGPSVCRSVGRLVGLPFFLPQNSSQNG